MGFDWPPEVCARRASRSLVSCSRPGLARRRPSRSSLCTLLPVRLISPASNSPGLVSPSEFDRNVLLHPQQMQPLPWGSFPFDACDRGGPHSRVCLARFVAPSGFFRPLGALLPPRPPRPYFMPRPSVGFTLRSFSLRGEGTCLSARSCPRAVARTVRGFHRAPRPTTGPCSLRKSVAPSPRGPGGSVAAPLGFRLSRGFFPSAMAGGFPLASSHELGLRARSPEFRSRSGRFVSAETTAPLEVRAPRVASRQFAANAALAHGFATAFGWHRCSSNTVSGRHRRSTQGSRDRLSVPRSLRTTCIPWIPASRAGRKAFRSSPGSSWAGFPPPLEVPRRQTLPLPASVDNRFLGGGKTGTAGAGVGGACGSEPAGGRARDAEGDAGRDLSIQSRSEARSASAERSPLVKSTCAAIGSPRKRRTTLLKPLDEESM